MPRLTVVRVARLVEMSVDGKSRPEIAKEVECSTVTVWVYQKKIGLL